MGGTYRLMRIAGIDIGIHYTWILAFGLITWSLAVGFFPDQNPNLPGSTYWVLAAIAALLLFASVLVHELAHSLTARSRGTPVNSINLFIFGGVSNLSGEPKSAGEEFLIAVVGPASSAVIAVASWIVVFALGDILGLVGDVLRYLALVNALLAGFNMLPGFPLDGGRVFRAILWGLTGSLSRATAIAATTGHILAFLFIGIGILEMFSGNLLGGIWIAFIGWFLNGAAESSRTTTRTEESFAGVRVVDIMDPDPETVSPTTRVDQVVRECLLRRGRRAMPVVHDGQVVGIVSLSDIKELAPERWADATVEEIMTSPPLYSIAPADEMSKALRLLAERDLNQLLVMEGDQLIGLLPRSNIISYLQLRQELHVNDARFLKNRGRTATE